MLAALAAGEHQCGTANQEIKKAGRYDQKEKMRNKMKFAIPVQPKINISEQEPEKSKDRINKDDPDGNSFGYNR
jgi:hypothetical protein